MTKISVIIPCYNVEKYIDRCLESIVDQTIGLSMLEIITVNDASTDHTLEKLYQWEKRFPSHQLDRLTIALLTLDAYKQYGAFDIYHNEIEWEFIQKFYLNTWYIIFTRFSREN